MPERTKECGIARAKAWQQRSGFGAGRRGSGIICQRASPPIRYHLVGPLGGLRTRILKVLSRGKPGNWEAVTVHSRSLQPSAPRPCYSIHPVKTCLGETRHSYPQSLIDYYPISLITTTTLSIPSFVVTTSIHLSIPTLYHTPSGYSRTLYLVPTPTFRPTLHTTPPILDYLQTQPTNPTMCFTDQQLLDLVKSAKSLPHLERLRFEFQNSCHKCRAESDFWAKADAHMIQARRRSENKSQEASAASASATTAALAAAAAAAAASRKPQ